MNKNYLSQLYQQFAQAILRRPQSMVGALAFALALGLNPILASTTVYAQKAAQEIAQTVSHASVNINSANAQALAQGLKGVGLSRAQEIVRYRETFGPFASIDELVEVKGVGLSTLEKNRAVLTLE